MENSGLKTNFSQNPNGFTLIEVLIAMTVFTIAALGMTTMLISTIKSNSKANNITTISTQSQDMVETLLSRPYDDTFFDNGTNVIPPYSPPPAAQRDVSLPPEVTSGTLQVNEDADAGIKQITMTWNYTLHGVNREMVLNFIKQSLD